MALMLQAQNEINSKRLLFLMMCRLLQHTYSIGLCGNELCKGEVRGCPEGAYSLLVRQVKIYIVMLDSLFEGV
jgi:hypothetical protein